LGINTGDTLASVEQVLANHLQSVMVGIGITIPLPTNYLCTLISSYLSSTISVNAVELFTALIQSICSIDNTVTGITNTINAINSPYSTSCLPSVDGSSDTHAVLQAVITQLCTTISDLSALTLDVNTNYVKIADFDALVQAYLDSTSSNNQQYLKMIPYAAVEYYGPLTNFDGTGAGLNSLGWDKIYLCNGNNGTPDKRGRVGVGAIVTPGVTAGPLSPVVDPTLAGNPNYALGDINGANSVTLLASQMPSHTHIATAYATSTVTDPGHFHYGGRTGENGGGGTIGLSSNTPQNYPTSTSTTGISVTTTVGVTNASAGGGAAHANIQPVLATYYIMYIP
jgi:microcystin-dependent protein